MRRLGITIAVVMAGASVALAAAGGGAHESNAAVSGGARKAAATSSEQSQAIAKEQIYIGNEEQIRAGEKLFRRHCAECHGEDGRGIGKAKNLQAPHVQTKAPAELVEFLRNGDLWRGMPSWAGMPEERRWQIVAYIKTLRANP